MCVLNALLTASALAVIQSPLDFVATEQINRCGPRCLQVCSAYLGKEIRSSQLNNLMPSDGQVTSFGELADAAGKLGLNSKAVRWGGRPTIPLNAPAILAVNLHGRSHFIVALARESDNFLVVDLPNAGWISYEKLSDHYAWNGESLHLAVDNFSLLPVHVAIHQRKIVILGFITVCLLSVLLRRAKDGSIINRKASNIRATAIYVTVFLLITGCSSEGKPVQIIGADESKADAPLTRMVTISPTTGSIRSLDGSSKATLDLSVRNTSDSLLHIISVTTSCGCTTAGNPSLTSLAGGETTSVPLRFNLPMTGIKPVQVTVNVANNLAASSVSANFVMHGKDQELPFFTSAPRFVKLKGARDHTINGEFRIRTRERVASDPWIHGINAAEPEVITIDFAIGELELASESCVREYTIAVKNKRNLTGSRYTINLTDAKGALIQDVILQIEDWLPVVVAPSTLFFRSLEREAASPLKLSAFWVDRSIVPTNLAVESDEELVKVMVLDTGGQPQRYDIEVWRDAECIAIPGSSCNVQLAFRLADGTDYTTTVPVVLQTNPESVSNHK